MTAHDRFRRIEARRAEDPSEVKTADRARIAAVIDTAPASAAPDSLELDQAPPRSDLGERAARGVTSQVLDDAPAPPSVDLALDSAPVSGQPFVRCARCGADSGIHAKVCDNCGVDLDTAEQRTFNEKVWETRKRNDERERRALAQMAEARAEVIRTSFRALPEPGMAPPPELLEPIEDHGGPILLDALAALQKPKWRWTAGAIVVGLPIVLVALGGPFFPKLGWAFAFLCFLTLLPRRGVRRLFEMWTGYRRR